MSHVKAMIAAHDLQSESEEYLGENLANAVRGINDPSSTVEDIMLSLREINISEGRVPFVIGIANNKMKEFGMAFKFVRKRGLFITGEEVIQRGIDYAKPYERVINISINHVEQIPSSEERDKLLVMLKDHAEYLSNFNDRAVKVLHNTDIVNLGNKVLVGLRRIF